MKIHFTVYPASQETPTPEQVINGMVPNAINSVELVLDSGHFVGEPISMPLDGIDRKIAAVLSNDGEPASNMDIAKVENHEA